MQAIDILDYTASILKRFPFRIAGSEGNKKISVFLRKELEKSCDTATSENFDIYPDSFNNLGKIFFFTYIAGLILNFAGGYFPYLSSFIFCVGILYSTVHFINMGSLFDKLFKRKTGNNVYGVLEPQAEIKKQIILSGHYDSPHVLKYLESYQKYYGFRIFISVFFYYINFLVSIYFSAENIFGWYQPVLNLILKIVILLGFVFAVQMFSFISKRSSPGAGDNLIAVGIILKLAEFFSKEKKTGKCLKNTRLIFFLPDAEEIGLKGSLDYVKKHQKEMKSIETYVINFDSLFKYKDLAILTRDRNGIEKLSLKMAGEVEKTAGSLGYLAQLKTVPLGGGGTDAASFAKAGIKAISIIGISTDFVREGLVYHTMNDTINNIEPKIVEACYNIAIKYIKHKDKE